jgi:hypothetical protein
MGFTRAEQAHLGESKTWMRHNAVINLMNPKTPSNQKIAFGRLPKVDSLLLAAGKQLGVVSASLK